MTSARAEPAGAAILNASAISASAAARNVRTVRRLGDRREGERFGDRRAERRYFGDRREERRDRVFAGDRRRGI